MDAQNITSRVSPTTQGKTGLGVSRPGDWDDLARWVAQLDATQRKAYAARIHDRLRVLDRILELVVNAKREGSLFYDQNGRLCCSRALSNGGAPGEGPSKAAATTS